MFGPENKLQASLAAGDQGGGLIVNDDLGINRASIMVIHDGGQLQLNWAGCPGVLLGAAEEGGRMVLLDPDGGTRARLPAETTTGMAARKAIDARGARRVSWGHESLSLRDV